ncbi:DMT family transporter [Sulfurimonas sp.]|jgi:drug/metabolite transporter (DMT)-like permease|uniref:DMT family transporter n=1 Tax=Sulfurimonas sp. TaxID=2022749 RepID=UPI0025F6DA4B|nr:DMT family transporter [Sulfurimonas sp.]MBT5935818.1 DMT family transporter [Sulfurimonas sp.]
MNLKNEDRLYSWLLVLAMLFWGGGWTALKILTINMPMDIIIFWRFFLMSLAFIPILYFFKKPIILNRGALKYIFGSSALNIAFMVSSFIAVKHGLAGAGSVIITSLSPLLTFLIVALLLSKAIQKHQYIGLFLGLVGGFVILELNDVDLFLQGSNIYFALSALFWAFVTIFSQRSHAYIHPIHYSFFISIVATIAAFIYAYDSDLLSVFNQDYVFWLALVYLAIFGQTIATTIFFMASGKLGSQRTSSFMFLVPIFALLTAWLVLDESIQLHIVIGGLISIIAVYFINTKFD